MLWSPATSRVPVDVMAVQEALTHSSLSAHFILCLSTVLWPHNKLMIDLTPVPGDALLIRNH